MKDGKISKVFNVKEIESLVDNDLFVAKVIIDMVRAVCDWPGNVRITIEEVEND